MRSLLSKLLSVVFPGYKVGKCGFLDRVAPKIFEDFGGALNKVFIRGREPVSIAHDTRPGTCINRPLH